MSRETEDRCFFSLRRIGRSHPLRGLFPVLGWLAIAGFALVPPGATAFGASGYLKPAVTAESLKKAEGYHQDGVELYRRRKYRAALRKFMAAQRVCPELFSAGYHVALAYRKMGNEDAAAAQLKKLNTSFPENIIAHNDLGVMYAGKSKEESDLLALLEFAVAVRNGENLLQGKEKKIPQVRVDLAMAYANLGALQLKSSKLASAEKSFRKAIEHHPPGFFGHFGLGNVLFAMKRFGEAKTAYRSAQEIEPGNDNVHVALAKCYLFSSDRSPRFAIAELKKVDAEAPPADVFDLLGDAYALLGNSDEAIRSYTRHLTLPEHKPQALYKLGVLYYNRGDRKQAKTYLQEFVAEARGDQEGALPTAYKLLGDISTEEKDYEAAVEAYLQGSKLRDAYFSCYYGLADSYFHLKQYEKAKEYLLLVLKGVPRNGSAQENQLRGKASSLLKKLSSRE